MQLQNMDDEGPRYMYYGPKKEDVRDGRSEERDIPASKNIIFCERGKRSVIEIIMKLIGLFFRKYNCFVG